MQGDNVLSWNVTNWITVVLMAVIGFAILSLAAQGVHRLKQSRAEAS